RSGSTRRGRARRGRRPRTTRSSACLAGSRTARRPAGSHALTFDRAAVVVGFAQVRAVAVFDLVETLDRARQRVVVDVGVAVRRCVAGLADVFGLLSMAGDRQDEGEPEQSEGA